jgi:hypothetical protein
MCPLFFLWCYQRSFHHNSIIFQKHNNSFLYLRWKGHLTPKHFQVTGVLGLGVGSNNVATFGTLWLEPYWGQIDDSLLRHFGMPVDLATPCKRSNLYCFCFLFRPHGRPHSSCLTPIFRIVMRKYHVFYFLRINIMFLCGLLQSSTCIM